MDYSKWDAVKDSDEEEVDPNEWRSVSLAEEHMEKRRSLQSEIEKWLRRQMAKLPRDGEDRSRPKGLSPLTPYRRIKPEERQTLAMLIAVCHFEDGETNLERHPEMLNLVRHNRWLEEDPGSLELLCRIHHQITRKETGNKGGLDGGSRMNRYGNDYSDDEDYNPSINSYDARMRDMLLGGINTLAAPKRVQCPGGLLELITQICTPTTEEARENRRKWQLKEFAKDALFDSLFPDLRREAEDCEDNESSMDLWILLFLALLAIAGIVVLAVVYSSAAAPHRRLNNSSIGSSEELNETVKVAVEAVASAVQAAGSVASEALSGAVSSNVADGHSEL